MSSSWSTNLRLPSRVGCSEVLIRARSDTETVKLFFLGFVLVFPLTNKLNPAFSKPYAWTAWQGSGPRRRLLGHAAAEGGQLGLLEIPIVFLPSMVGCSDVFIRARSDAETAALYFSLCVLSRRSNDCFRACGY